MKGLSPSSLKAIERMRSRIMPGIWIQSRRGWIEGVYGDSEDWGTVRSQVVGEIAPERASEIELDVKSESRQLFRLTLPADIDVCAGDRFNPDGSVQYYVTLGVLAVEGGATAQYAIVAANPLGNSS